MNATVIMNCYNEKFEFLSMAITSYLIQVDVEIQLIVSTVEDDQCIEFINKNFPSVELCIYPKIEHGGKSPNGSFRQINKALPMMKNDWFCFASSNDFAQNNKIKSEIECCVANKKLICYSAFNNVSVSGEFIKKINFHDYDREKHSLGNFVSDCALIHKSIVQKYLPFKIEFNNYAYWDLWLRVYKGEGNVFCYNNISTWNYRQAEDSMHLLRKKSEAQIKIALMDKTRMLKTHR